MAATGGRIGIKFLICISLVFYFAPTAGKPVAMLFDVHDAGSGPDCEGDAARQRPR